MLPASVIAGALWDRYGPRPAFLFGAGLAVLAAAGSLRSPPRPLVKTGYAHATSSIVSARHRAT